MRRMKCLKFSPFLLAFSALTTCVKEYPLSISGSGNSILVVDAVLCHSNKPDINDYKIQIYKSESIKGQTPNQIPIQQANAEIVVNDSAVYPLIEREAGTYELLQRPIFKTGYRYKLRFNAVGNSYESSAETLPDSVPILKIYAQLREKPNANRAFNVYVDIQDNPTVRNYYRWSAIQWERLEYCQYCYEAPMRSPVCRPDLFGSLGGEKLVRNNRCQSDCYEILRSNPNNSLSDFFLMATLFRNNPLQKFPTIFLMAL
ncbi:MAG: DUF4249 domain-containing protein [Saprospiraceae bacterium]|nr:DUF4249 domain-containing protein [Saprospiraceae bacterium]